MIILNWNEGGRVNYKMFSFVNMYSYTMLRNRDDFGSIAFMSDGFLLSFIARIFGKKIYRFSFDMTSLAPIIFIENKEKKFAFVGSTQSNIEAFSKFVESRFNILPCYISSGYFDDDGSEICKNIISSGADIVVVGLGTPLQEEFLMKLEENSFKGVSFTCGGFFTQTASSGGDYYPTFIDKMNLRFLYRMVKEPHTIKRYFFIYPKGIFLFILDILARRHNFK